MAYCRHCGKEIADEAVVCINCGRDLGTKDTSTINDTGGFAWGLLGFFVPLAGLILYLVWKDTKPKCAKAAGIGALVSTIGWVASYLCFFLSTMFFWI